MNVLVFAMLVVVGVLAGWLAGFVMERGGYGLRWDVTLGLAGSAVATWIFWVLGVAPGAGLTVVAVVAFVGAAIAIVAQRKIWRTTSMGQDAQKVSFRERWSAARPTKTVVVWSWVASIIVTMIIGFSWGGWVTGGTARKMADAIGENAVVTRLAPMCVVRFQQDPRKDQKLKELKGISTWEKADYIKKQGWATMPGEREPESRVAEECGKLLMLIS